MASTWVVADAALLSELGVEHTAAIELAGERVTPRALGKRLMARNGRPPFDLVLIGRHGEVRRSYRVQVVVFEQGWLDSVEAAYVEELNREHVDGDILNGFYQGRPWSERPERTYAEALAAFRMAIAMREDLTAGRSGKAIAIERPGDYSRHLADAREILRPVNRPLALTALSAAGFLDNDFSDPARRLMDPTLERGITLFRHLTLGTPLRWTADGHRRTRLALDSHTTSLLAAVDALASDDREAADRILAELSTRTMAMRDISCAKKVMALALYRTLDFADEQLLTGDPMFARFLEERPH